MIACTTNFGTPVIIGDLLLSDVTKPEEFVLPSVSDNILEYLEENSRYPVQLSRKIYLITEHVCVALAGTVKRFKPFLQDFSIFCKSHENLQPSQLSNFLNEYVENDPYRHEVHALIFLFYEAEGEKYIGRFIKGNGIEGAVPAFEYLFALGSGAIDFRREMLEAGTLTSSLVPGTVEYAIQLNAILIARILAAERALMHTMKKWWGAGFEMIYIEQGRFKLFDDVCYIVNYADVKNGGMDFPAPITVMRYKYYGDVLIITVIQAVTGQTEVTDSQVVIKYLEFKARQFPVLPVDFPGEFVITDVMQTASFTCSRNGMGYIIDTGTGKYMPASFNVGRQLTVVYEDEKSLVITMDRQINDDLVNEAKKNMIK